MDNQINIAPKTVTIVGWLMFVGGLISLVTSIPAILLAHKLGLNGLIMGNVIGIFVSIAMVVLSFGIRKMKKWGLYGYLAAFILAVVLTALAAGSNLGQYPSSLIVGLALVIYFLAIRKKFV